MERLFVYECVLCTLYSIPAMTVAFTLVHVITYTLQLLGSGVVCGRAQKLGSLAYELLTGGRILIALSACAKNNDNLLAGEPKAYRNCHIRSFERAQVRFYEFTLTKVLKPNRHIRNGYGRFPMVQTEFIYEYKSYPLCSDESDSTEPLKGSHCALRHSIKSSSGHSEREIKIPTGKERFPCFFRYYYWNQF